MEHKILITGASGLLGRSIYRKFKCMGWKNINGLAFTRVTDELFKIDLTKEEEVRMAMLSFRPQFVIHSAAQRFPDKVDSDPDSARDLNVKATQHIVETAREIGAQVLYISTDYVFDGNKGKPYTTEDKPNPINLYGATKLEGEIVTLKYPDNMVLRVPVLYGPVTYIQESAVTSLLLPLRRSDGIAKISHLELRCPSHVQDISLICYQLANASLNNQRIHGIFQWCGEEKMTKFDMVIKMAESFKLPHSHIEPTMELGVNGAAKRPLDTEMDRSRLTKLGFGQHTPFKKGIETFRDILHVQ